MYIISLSKTSPTALAITAMLALATTESQAVVTVIHGDSFSYEKGRFYMEPDSTEEIFWPNTTFEWHGETMESIGLGSLDATPKTVWNGNGDTIQFVYDAGTTVPEPEPAVFLVFSGVALFLRQNRETSVGGAQ